MDISKAALDELLEVNAADWSREADEIGAFLDEFGDSLPKEIREEQAALAKRLGHVGAAV
jgi:GTP-dependent phosphoenolpyruvate carboxykinase